MSEARPPAPLAGLRVVDLSRVLAGPLASQQLGDLGADVIKVESLDGGDVTRTWGPPFVDDDRSAYYLCANRGKRSIACDLERAEGRHVVRELVARADVLVENFRPGRLAAWDLDPAALRRAHPRLITCSISGFGSCGPRREEGGYDALVQAMSGLMAITGSASGEWSKVGVAVVDVICGLFAASGILALLARREVLGPDERHVEVALFDSALAALVNVASATLATGVDAPRLGNAHPTIVPYEVFPSVDGEVFIAVGNDVQWARLATLLGHAEWAEGNWASNPGRVRDRERLVMALTAVTRRHERSWLMERLLAAGIPVGPLQSVAEALADPVVTARGLVVEHPDGTRSVASPLRGAGDARRPTAAPAPHLGAQTRAILAEAGFDEGAIEALLAARVVTAGP